MDTQTPLRRLIARLIEGRADRVTERICGVRSEHYLLPAQFTAVSIRGRSPLVSSIVVMLQWDESNVESAVPTARPRTLSDIEARILQGVAIGLSTVNLAARLYLSRQGVEYHVTRMMKKFKAPNRAALVSRAYSMGVLDAGCWPPRVGDQFIK